MTTRASLLVLLMDGRMVDTVVHEQLRTKPRKGGAGCEEVWFRDTVVCAVSLDWLDTPVSAHGCSRDQVSVYHLVVRVR